MIIIWSTYALALLRNTATCLTSLMICDTGFKGVDASVGGGGGGGGGGRGGTGAPAGVKVVPTETWLCGLATIIIAIWALNFCNSSSRAEIFCIASLLFESSSFPILSRSDWSVDASSSVSFCGLQSSMNDSSSKKPSEFKFDKLLPSSVIQATSAREAISIPDKGFPCIISCDRDSFLDRLSLSWDGKEQ